HRSIGKQFSPSILEWKRRSRKSISSPVASQLLFQFDEFSIYPSAVRGRPNKLLACHFDMNYVSAYNYIKALGFNHFARKEAVFNSFTHRLFPDVSPETASGILKGCLQTGNIYTVHHDVFSAWSVPCKTVQKTHCGCQTQSLAKRQGTTSLTTTAYSPEIFCKIIISKS
ncbi:hypothetical protein L9F63_023074, partial [Diploptera punctata]